MNDESKQSIVALKRQRGTRRTVHPTAREVSLARLLLRVAECVASRDRDQDFIEVYNEVKVIAEPMLRAALEGESDGTAA